MRLKISHQLSLLLTLAVVVAVAVVGALSAWNLRNGFTDYLRLRDEEQLTRLVALIEQRAAIDPSLQWLRGDHRAMRDLMDEFNGRPGPPAPPGDGPLAEYPIDGPPPRHLGSDPPPLFGGLFEPPRTGPPPGSPNRFGERLIIRDMQGQYLAGHDHLDETKITQRAIKVSGAAVAMIGLEEDTAPAGVDALFLKHQYNGLAITGLATICLTLCLGLWAASRWSRPLLALQRSTRLIASGQMPPHLAPAGAREIAQLIQDVNLMAEALARMESERRLWVAQMSHELRTPLAV
jgi:two-component system sensor histidine kinase BaeS